MTLDQILDALYNSGLTLVSGFARIHGCTAYWLYRGDTEVLAHVGLMDIERWLLEQ